MTAQLPLPVAPEASATPVGAAAALIEDGDGGRVFLHGELVFAWDTDDLAGRRLAAVQLVRIRAATAVAVAAGFGIDTETLRRWTITLDESGIGGLLPGKRGPKGPSKLTAALVADIRARRAAKASLRAIAAATGVSTHTVRRALTDPAPTDESEPTAIAPDPTGDRDGGPGDDGDDLPAADTGGAQTPDAIDVDSGDLADADPDADGNEGGRYLPVLADPESRHEERAMARWGLLEHAHPVFTPSARAPLAGLFLALPGLAATGLLGCAHEVFRRLPNGFYGLDTVLVEAALRTLAGQPRAEGATRIDPVALGRVLGLDRAPEVKTIRRRLHQLADTGKADELIAGMAAHHLNPVVTSAGDAGDGGVDEDPAAMLYVDGHVRAYHGTRKLAKTHMSRVKFPAPATVETWVSDADGDPVMVVMSEPGASLAGELRRLLPELRQAIGDDRRVLVGFDRGGWSPVLFKHMDAAGFDVLTWRKGSVDDLPADQFDEYKLVDEAGRKHTWTLADTMVDLPIDKKGNTFTLRQVTRQDAKDGKQVHILTTRTDLDVTDVVYRMGGRWRLENAFRYGRMHLDLDSHDAYAAGDDDPNRLVPNPAKKKTYKAVVAARTAYENAAAAADRALAELRTPAPGTTVVITNADYNATTAGQRAAEAALAAAEAVHQDTPTRLPLREVNPGQQVLETQMKLLTHAIKIAAFNATTALVRDLRIHTGYARANKEAHTLIRQVLTQSGDIDPDLVAGTLTIRLDPMPTRRATIAVAQLCEHLTATKTVYPDTDLVLRYEIKTRR